MKLAGNCQGSLLTMKTLLGWDSMEQMFRFRATIDRTAKLDFIQGFVC